MAMRASAVLCAAGALCVLLAGCGTDQQLSLRAIFQGDSVKDTFVVGGTLDSVAATLKVKMTGLGLTIQETRDGDTIRLTSQSGPNRFAVVLSQVQTAQGPRIQGRVNWIDQRDEAMNVKLLRLAMEFVVNE